MQRWKRLKIRRHLTVCCHLAIFPAKSRYQRVTRGTVHAIPLSTVRSGYMVNAIHCRQAASLPNVVLHVPLGNVIELLV